MKITEVRIQVRNEEKLTALATITFDDSFVVRGCKIIQGTEGFFVAMPSQKLKNGMSRDIAHPIDTTMRNAIEETVIRAFLTKARRHNEM